MSLDQVSNVLWSVATDLQPAFVKKLQVLSKANKKVTSETACHMCTARRCMISALGIVWHFYLFVKKKKGVIKVKLKTFQLIRFTCALEIIFEKQHMWF